MTIVWIIVAVAVVVVIAAIVVRSRSDDQLESGGSYGRQLDSDDE